MGAVARRKKSDNQIEISKALFILLKKKTIAQDIVGEKFPYCAKRDLH